MLITASYLLQRQTGSVLTVLLPNSSSLNWKHDTESRVTWIELLYMDVHLQQYPCISENPCRLLHSACTSHTRTASITGWRN